MRGSSWIVRFILAAAALSAAAGATAQTKEQKDQKDQAQEVTVFAAASLTNAFEDVGRAYRGLTRNRVRFSFAASSTLARQIESGGPANIFVSADEEWMDHLARKGKIIGSSRRPLLTNRLVLIVPTPHPERSPGTAGSLPRVDLKPGFDLEFLLGPEGRLAIGDPSHVPAGRYAQDALTALKVWDIAEPRLVRGDSVRVALALVERGEVPAGIVYATDAALTNKVRVVAVFPENTHPPIVYPIGLVTGNDTAEAVEFASFLRSDTARSIFRKYGFGFP